MKPFFISLLIVIHSWYPQSCCAEQHCKPVPCEELVEQADGKWRWHDYYFVRSVVYPSQDKFCHVCTIGPNGQCAFIQQGV